jgi:murein DD-endopeptidase MepM/ murein hydrolase activator NlpD
MKKRWSITITSEDEKGSKNIKIPPAGVIFIVSFIVVLIAIFAIETLVLLSFRDDLSTVAVLKIKEHDRKHQLSVLEKKVENLDRELGLLRDFNSRLSDIISGGTGSSGVDKDKDNDASTNDLKSEIATENFLARTLHSRIRDISDIIYGEKEVSKDLLAQLERKRSIIAHTPSRWPVKGWLSCPFGTRRSPFTGRRTFHRGVDISAKKGTPVYATADGIVTSYGRQGRIGNLLVINHGYGIVTRYGHLSKNQAKPGQYVHKGDVVAFVGNTGRSTGPHLHYEVLLNGIHVNPRRYMLK